ncbi:MAG TPA: VWA domain-containing protein [Thermoanaerobaculia bacterium]|nr:VWA domain-containing protein [Thermoanaerobaculia bacterium]
MHRSASILLSIVFLAPLASAAAAEDDLALDGVWLRIDEESDDVEALVEEVLMGDAGAPRGGVGWTGGGRRGGIGRGGPPQPGSRWGRSPSSRPPMGSLEDRAAERFAELARALDLLRIQSDGELLLMQDANRETRVIFTDGRMLTDGLGRRTTSRLEGTSLIVETRDENGGRTERFEPGPGGERLAVTTDLHGDAAPGASRNLAFRTVYERVESKEPATPVTELSEPSLRPTATAPTATAQTDAAAPTDTAQNDTAQNDTAPTDRAPTEGAPTVRARLAGSQDSGARDSESPAGAADPAPSAAASIRLLPPAVNPGQLLRGKVQLEALTIDPTIQIVEFLLDGERIEKRDLPPFEARVQLADPPREQVVEAVAYTGRGRRVGSDRIVLNRLDPPFRVRIVGFDGTGDDGALGVQAEVSVPREAELESVTFYRNDEAFSTLAAAELPASPGGRVTGTVEVAEVGPQDFVRVAARLRDGRELEDVELLQQGSGADFAEELDVRLVQLQVLAVDRAGRPVSDLTESDFSVREDREPRTIDRVQPSRDISLVLGLAVDSSGSMDPLWGAVRQAAEQFLATTLAERDQAFLVDFDEQLRLLQGVTGDKNALYRALDRLQPQGGTALYDSILFSLLQYQGEPGRRALIVLTDGVDSASEADPERAIELGKRLGVPVYVIAMRSPYESVGFPSGRPGFGQGGGFAAASTARNNLRLITDPTGGRLFQVGNVEQVHNAFAQIQDELRHQYVLTYYSERTPEQGPAPEVDVERKGVKVKTAIPLDLAQ